MLYKNFIQNLENHNFGKIRFDLYSSLTEEIEHKNLLSHIKTSKKVLTFGNSKIKKKNYQKTPIFLGDVDIKSISI